MLSWMPFPLEARRRGGLTRAAQIAKPERNALICQLATTGVGLDVLAREHGITVRRVKAIIAKWQDKAGQAA
jgi:hypothetical protein